MEAFYNIVFERTILSSILEVYQPDQVDEFMSQLTEDLFFMETHKHIYNAISTLYASRQPIEEEFIKGVLSKQGQWDERAMLDIMTVSPVGKIDVYVSQLKEYARKRTLNQLAINIQKMLHEGHASADDVIAFIDIQLTRMDEDNGSIMPVTMSQAIQEYEAMEEPPKISTGIRKVDEMLCGGFEPAQLIHLGGERNVGKTTLLKQVLYNTSSGFDSLFFSFEMPKWKMAKLTKKMMGDADLNRYRIIDTEMMQSRDVMDVARMIRTMWRKFGIRFVLIDSKMKLTHKTFKGNNDSDRKGDIDAVLNQVVQETGIVLMMIVQLSKDDIKNGSMSSYGSGLSDYEADMQLMMYKSKDGQNVELKITKNRQEVLHDPTQLFLNKDQLKFEDIRFTTIEYETIPADAPSVMGGVNENKIEVNVI